jgi:glycosyltransferase involved in cell wall biosynthesis
VLNLLWASAVCPFPPQGGNHQRHYHLLAAVGKRHRITLLYPSTGTAVPPELSELCEVVHPIVAQRAPSTRLSRIVRRLGGHPDCIVPPAIDDMIARATELGRTAQYDAAIGALGVSQAAYAANARLTVIDEQNIEGDLYAQLFRGERWSSRKLARWHDAMLVDRFERRAVQRADVVTVCSDADRRVVSTRLSRRDEPVLVPNGVSTEFVSFSGEPRDRNRIVMVGGMSYAPNVDGAVYLVREVMPKIWARRPETILELVGSNPAPEVVALKEPRIHVTGTVEDTRPYLRRAAVEVVPLRSGGGTRLKILEAMAAGIPLVSTRRGAEGLHVEDGVELVLADTADTIAEGVLALLADESRARTIAAAARARVVNEYDWRMIGERFAAELERRVHAAR